MKKITAIIAMLAIATLASCNQRDTEVDVDAPEGVQTTAELNGDGTTTITVDAPVTDLDVNGEEVIDTDVDTREVVEETRVVDAEAAADSNTAVDATGVNSTLN